MVLRVESRRPLVQLEASNIKLQHNLNILLLEGDNEPGVAVLQSCCVHFHVSMGTQGVPLHGGISVCRVKPLPPVAVLSGSSYSQQINVACWELYNNCLV